jgi:UDP-glucose 4-epimerase
MRVAVTGGSGFIGSHVVDHLLAAGHEVRVIDLATTWLNPAAEHCATDLFDDAGMVAHLAAVADVNDVDKDPVRAVRLNVEGTARVLEAARRQSVRRVILASTVWVYGATAGDGERSENALVELSRAGHVYVSTKLAAEMLVHSYRQMYGQEFTILRYGIPYGPRMRPALVIAKFVKFAQEGQPITIAGTGDQQRHYVYVEDIADAHVRALQPAAADQTLALEGGVGVSVREIADTVCSLVGPTTITHVPARNADYSGVGVSNTLAKELLDWSPVTSFADGVQRYLDWLESQQP